NKTSSDQSRIEIVANASPATAPKIGSGSGLTADSSVLTLTLAFLDFGLDFAQSFPFHAQFCHFGLVFCLFVDIHFLHNTNAKQTYIWQFLSVFGHLSSFLEGDLYTLFESDKEDEIWKNQHEYNLISWRLYDFCGIHILLIENGLAIHMLTEKKYPLSQELLSKMLSKKLEVDHESSQAIELHRFIRSQVKK
ncbi:hypothetical protein Tco_1298306, partial [Tanacetum coccineum]